MGKITFIKINGFHTERFSFLFSIIFLYGIQIFAFDSNMKYASIQIFQLSSEDIDKDDDGILDTVEDQNEDGDNNYLTNPSDRDGDGIPNYLDIDSDGDGILDNYEAQRTIRYVAPSGIDSNNNGLDDAYEGTYGFGIIPINSDKTVIPDYLDYDSDIDGIRDNIESQSYLEYVPPSGFDVNQNGLDDAYEGGFGFGIIPINSDDDQYPNYRDFDSDNDGIKDKVEAQTSEGYIPPIGDNNNNGIDDSYEDGLSPIDTDGDGIPDFHDIDSDNDGILDNYEAQSTADYVAPDGIDSTRDGLDEVYGQGGIEPQYNSDEDSKPDYRDLDSDNDGIPDNVEGQTTSGYVPPSGLDSDKDGLDDAYEGSGNQGVEMVNTDSDEEPDYRDLDSDNDSVPDNNEGNDFNFDGIADQTYTGIDTDGDGLDDGYEGSDVNDGFDVNDEIDDPANDLPDTDGTEDVNYRDLDDDGDGIGTPDEDANNDGDPTNDDSDNDGTPDYLDPDSAIELDVVDDTVSTPIDTPIDIDILENDHGVPSDGILTVTDPSNGTVEINDGGTPDDISDDTIIYTPNDDFEGTEVIEYTVCDAEGNCDTATVTITVGDPVALDVVDDFVSTPIDTPIDIDILQNDLGVPSDGILTVTDPSNGTVEINDGGTPDDISDDTIIYTPNDGFEGTEVIEYTVCDADGNCDTATVTITVGDPIALDVVDDFVSTPIDTPIEIDILENDFGVPNDGILTVTDPSNGTVEINDGGTPDDISDDTIIYTPNDGFEGIDIIDYTVCDVFDNCDSATVEITVVDNDSTDIDDNPIEVNQMVTPNGDGRNEFLFIRGVDKIRSSTLKIFNRWGVAVYEGENYNNQNNVFDGRSRGRSTLGVDEYLPAGIYFYIFDYTTFEGESKVDSEYLYISR